MASEALATALGVISITCRIQLKSRQESILFLFAMWRGIIPNVIINMKVVGHCTEFVEFSNDPLPKFIDEG